MRHHLVILHGTPSEREPVRQLVRRWIARLEKALDKAFNERSSAALLHVVVDENRVRSLYRASAVLSVPGGRLATQEERHDLVEAVREVFAEIERQLRRHLEKLSRSDAYKRKGRREQLHRKKGQVIPAKA